MSTLYHHLMNTMIVTFIMTNLRHLYVLQKQRRMWLRSQFVSANHIVHTKVETPYHDNDLIMTPIISPQSG
jgi:hypothetical protein